MTTASARRLVDLRDRLAESGVRELVEELRSTGGRADGEGAILGLEGPEGIVAGVLLTRAGEGVGLAALAVPVAHRGRGFARELVEAVADVVAAPSLVADVDPGWVPFLIRCGFEGDATATGSMVRCRLALAATPVEEAVPPVTLSAFETAVRAAWAADTAEDPTSWSPENPARDHCDRTALVVRAHFGGEILIANVIRAGRRVERHAWNRLPSGLVLDLTRKQFRAGEAFDEPKVGEPLSRAGSARRLALFGARVREGLATPSNQPRGGALSLPPGPQ